MVHGIYLVQGFGGESILLPLYMPRLELNEYPYYSQ
jgi:hypothetical protein